MDVRLKLAYFATFKGASNLDKALQGYCWLESSKDYDIQPLRRSSSTSAVDVVSTSVTVTKAAVMGRK